MLSTTGLPAEEPHGGALVRARAAFPAAPLPWIDLSTGINPWPWALPPLPAELWTRLPEAGLDLAFRARAAEAVGAPGPAFVAAAPGTQALIQLLPRLVPPGTVAVVGPTYGEHAACWRLAGHRVADVPDLEAAVAAGAAVAVLVNPNNPDGRAVAPAAVLDAAAAQAARGGWLVVDEAFADALPVGSVAHAAGAPGLVVLRSFGKFYGLAGLRLGFALAAPEVAAVLRRALGPWAVPGPALAAGAAAYADRAWQAATRERLAAAAARLDGVLSGAGLRVLGGTPLFRLAEAPADDAAGIVRALAGAGILVRTFAAEPSRLRFGLPPDEAALARLAAALGRA